MEPGCQNDKVLVIVLNIEIQFEFHIKARCLVPWYQLVYQEKGNNRM